MADEHSDESMRRLRDSDPATGSHPDLHRLRALIAHRAPASQRTHAQGADTATGIDDDLLRGPRMRTPWIAAAAVAALAVGVGGYALGQQQGEGTVVLADNPLTPAIGPGSAVGEGDLPSEAVLTSSTDSGAGMAEGISQAYDPGPVRLVAGTGLSTERTTGQVRTLVAGQEPQEFLDAWTAATGFAGVPLAQDSDVFGGDGVFDPDTGRAMTVHDDGAALSFSYSDVYRDEYCAQNYAGMTEEDLAVLRQEWQDAFGDELAMPSADSCVTPEGARPTDEEALTLAGDFLRDAGVPVQDYTLETIDYGEPDSLYVTVEAWPEGVDRYGPLQASVTVAPGGVVTAYASLGEMTSLGDYQVISPVEAVQRYGLREFSMEYGISLPEDALAGDAAVEFVEPTLPEPVSLEPGDRLPLLLKDKTVVDAELVQGTLWTESGSVEVPAWKLVTEDGMGYPVLALADEEIDWRAWE